MFEASSALRLPLDPVGLSYAMALRGVRPRLPVEPFTYGEFGCGTAERLILFAACNPEGSFFGFDPDMAKLIKASHMAEQLGVANVTFSAADAQQLHAAVSDGTISKQSFDYLIYNSIDNADQENLAALHSASEALLRDNGCFVYRYRLYNSADADASLFKSVTARVLAERPDADEHFAQSWLHLCQIYFAAHPSMADAFDKAIKDKQGLQWLREQTAGATADSNVIAVGATFSGSGFTFLGSAVIAQNYMELSVPEAAHAPLKEWQKHSLYEAIKDLAMRNSERTDIWGREPLRRVENLIALFGGFTYGTTEAPERIARTVTYQGKSISFVGPLYDSILSLATVMPVTMGDLVTHETLAGIDPLTILNSMQLLVACGLLHPMRASFEGGIEMDNPKLIGGYNKSLAGASLDLQDHAFASTVVGRPVVYSGMTTLVLQALDKGGLHEIANLLAEQLIRLSQHPYLRPLRLNDAQRAQDESLRQIEAAFTQSMVRWFSLGILTTQPRKP